MGVKVLQGVLRHPEPTGTDRMVLLVLAWHADDATGECWPGVDLVAQESARKPRVVQYALQRLASAGHIKIEPHGAPVTTRPWQYRPNLYRVLSGARPCTSSPSTVVHTDAPPVVHADVVSGARERRPVVHARAPKQTRNHQEPSRPFKDRAHALAKLAFEQKPKPMTAGKFPAVLQMIETAFEAGHAAEDIETAIRAGVGTWTLDGLSYAITRARHATGTVSYDAPEAVYR